MWNVVHRTTTGITDQQELVISAQTTDRVKQTNTVKQNANHILKLRHKKLQELSYCCGLVFDPSYHHPNQQSDR